MQHIKKTSILLIILSGNSIASIFAQSVVAPYYSIRSQGAYAPRHSVDLFNYRYKQDFDQTYGTLAITPEYTRSFDSNHITRCLFGDSLINCDSIVISGSGVENRGQKDWLADYFYLPNDFKSTICFKPIVDTFLVDFTFHINLDRWAHGLYFIAHAPLAHTRWNLRIRENVINRGVQAQPAGLFTPAQLQRGTLLEDFSAYIQGKLVKPVEQTVTNINFLTVMQQLKQAKMSCEREIKTRFADVRAALGWDWIQDDYHVGFNFQISAPTGNRPKAEFLFEPISGNGHHWEFGGSFNTHYTVWRNNDETSHIALFFDANLTHLFKAAQKRTFDLCSKPLSRYMLAQKMGPANSSDNKNLKGDGVAPTAQFKKEFTPVANISTINVSVSSGIQADVIVMAHFTRKKWSAELGYNFWARSCESIRARGANILDNNSTWALKGDARVFGFAMAADNMDPMLDQNEPVALSATQSKATIHAGLNGTNTTNANIDSPQLATAGGGDTNLNNQTAGGAAQINTSINPIFIKETDLNICGGRTTGLSSSFFTHISYQIDERNGWIPHVGIGGQIEVDHGIKKECDDSCIRCNLSQWGLWVKVGFSFE